MTRDHVPVLYQEVLEWLQPRPSGRYIDGTVGAGGHAAGILEASSPDGRLLALDRDLEAIAFARQRLSPFSDRVTFVHASYADMKSLAPQLGFGQVDGILLDLGLSSRQLNNAGRGFSFSKEGPLDMRFDQSKGQTAAELVNEMGERQLADLLWRFGEIRQSRRLATAIVRGRPFRTTAELAEVAAQFQERGKRKSPAAQLFQALRIAVNQELEALEAGLEGAVSLLRPAGRLVAISFHSLEDRQVKQFVREKSKDCVCPPEQPVCTCETEPVLRPVTRRAIKPSAGEVAANARSRSARLRVAEKIAVLES